MAISVLMLPLGTPSMTSMRWIVAVPTPDFSDKSPAVHLNNARPALICPLVINLIYLYTDLN
jgi:hypothetical protein